MTPRRALKLALRGVRLPPDERLVALHALALLLRAAGSLRARGLAGTEARLHAPVVAASLNPARVADIVEVVASLVPGATCLARSLALTRLVHQRAALCIGVRPGERELDAHAWVELDGVVLNDAVDVRERYAVIETRRAAG